jgi:hypothetical protein
MEKAGPEMDRVRELSAANDSAGALEHARAAAKLVPESVGLRVQVLVIEAAAAFDRKDFAAGVRASEQAAALAPAVLMVQAAWASSLAAQYASTGDESFARQSRERLAAAHALSKSDEDRAALAEYEERIQYRLRTREIIDKKTYDARFRKGKQP